MSRRIRAVAGIVGPQDEGQRIQIMIDADIAVVVDNPDGTTVSLRLRSITAKHYDGHDSATAWTFHSEEHDLPVIFLRDG